MKIEVVTIIPSLASCRRLIIGKDYDVRCYGKATNSSEVAYLINDEDGKPIALYKSEVKIKTNV